MKKIVIASTLLLSTSMFAQKSAGTEAKCPVMHGGGAASTKVDPPMGSKGTTNKDWWPNQLNLSVLRQNSSLSDPMGTGFNYKKEFSSLDYAALKKDIQNVLTTSQDWWPADFGIMDHCLFEWHGTALERTVQVMEEEVLLQDNSDLLH